MSKGRNKIFKLLISLLQFSAIIFGIISLPNVKCESEITYIVKCKGCNKDNNWPKIIGDSFNNPSKVKINNEVHNFNHNWYKLDEEISTITLTYQRDIDSYADMFNGITLIEEITFVNFKTKKPKSMQNMFFKSPVKYIRFGQNFDTSEVTDMSHMFEECKELLEIDLSDFNTASVTTMHSMFRFCEKIQVIDARSFDTSKVTNMYDMFGYSKNLVYVNVSSFNTQSVQVMQGIFINCHALKYIDISNFDYNTFLASCPESNSNPDSCKFHYTFAYCENLICLNFKTFQFVDRVNDNTFNNRNSNIKFCVDESNIKVTNSDLKNLLKNNCDDQCFKDMSKKFDISSNSYVDSCNTNKFDFNDLCWDDCPYNYYRIYTDRRTCLKEKPGENYFLDSTNNIYYKCYSTCKTCNIRQNGKYHNCEQCLEGFSFMDNTKDIYALEKNCYKNCEKYYYFNSDNEYFCTEECPSGFKLIKNKNKCIDKCTNDKIYKKEYNNTCLISCPKGTVDIDNKCQPCYESCEECNEVGSKYDHKCSKCKDGFSNLLNNDNCYKNCAHYYYFNDKDYICLDENKCPSDYKLINGQTKCIKECKDDKIFNSHFEYNGGCYEACSRESYTEGEKDFCKCMTNTTCKDCSLLAIENKLCSSCDTENDYYPIKEEKENNDIMNCYSSSTIPKNYILINELYVPCYETCGTCKEIGSDDNHKCESCIEGYSQLNNDKNCYKVCDHYYYFDKNKKYICLEEDKCPPDYKLINGEKKCIENCANDEIFNSKFEYNGGCYKTCTEGTYTEGGKEFCKCMTNTTCEKCFLSAIDKKLCSTCNIAKGYYPKKEENGNEFMNCYDSSTIPKNYLLIEANSQYEPCYNTCATCKEISLLDNDHKCDTCIEGYVKLQNNDNCYKECDNYYYFNEQNEYKCLKQDECPPNYKLINGKKRCVLECEKDDFYHFNFEYNGGCYENCPEGSYEEGGKKFCKCMTNTTCEKCSASAIEKKLCSTCNIDKGYYPIKGENNNGLINCYNSITIPKNYFLNSDNLYEPCYESCGSCDEKGTLLDHKCKTCKDDTYENLNGDDNCYKKCDHYYYFNESNHYICLDENKCPNDYKLIDGTNKCIKECRFDTIFESIYEFNGRCYKNCPNGYYSDGEKQICLCMSDISCKDCPSENNPNKLCSTCNTDNEYYPIEGENEKSLKNCYSTSTIPSNYIFNYEKKLFEVCYKSCLTCSEISTLEHDQKCTSCQNGYHTDTNNANNCVQLCSNFFYYDKNDNNNLKCIDECSGDYSKNVDSTEKCINNCEEENLYEYNNVCYATCPNGYFKKNEINTCKCMTNITCQECPISNDENVLCYSCNEEEGYYPIKGENNNGLFNCYNSATIPKNYFLNTDKLYELCYESCGSCDEKGTSSKDHKCKTCKDNTYEKLNKNDNCYEKCAHYYYFDDDGEYQCLDENKCPNDYKLIDGTNKCIKECRFDTIFESIYEFNGRCYKNCPNGYYSDGEKQICLCMSDISCKDCPSENNPNKLCSTCNTDNEYYPKEEEIDNLMKCYDRTTITSNYILISGQYRKCYDSCQTCDEISTSDDDHKCKDCIDGYIKLQKNDNCYKKCDFYYFFDEHGKYHCLTENQCPTNYKLIDGTNQCIKDCKEFNKYEYNNICYQECPQYYTDTYNDHICKLNCPKFDLYFNYEKTDCISTIPKGYYLQDAENKILGKCHENCEECEGGPDENNNNCEKCPNTNTIYYDLGNCRSSCVNGNYIDENLVKKCKCSNNIECKACDIRGNCFSCNNELGYYQIEDLNGENQDNNGIIKCAKDPEGFYLSGDIYKKCHEKCKSCTDAGEDKCIECNPQFEFRNDFPEDKKCYKKCSFNYYYDSDNNNVCTPNSDCPNDMKLVESKKRCIDHCKNENIFKFEFEGKCFENCPEGTRNSFEDNSICELVPEETDEKEEETECNLKLNEFTLLNDTLTTEDLNNFTTIYAKKYGDSGSYITKLENEYFKIFIYNNIFCLQNVSRDAKLVDFGSNYINILNRYGLSDPIVTIISDKKSNSSTFALAHPDSGELLRDASDDLRRTEISVLEDIYTLLSYLGDIKRKYIIHMLKQGIDVFDPNNKFYTNLCFYYDSPNDKDIPMSDRPYFFSDIPKCDTGCIYQGIDFKLAKFKCKCIYRSFSGENPEGDGDTQIRQSSNDAYPKKKNSPNIEVLKCLGDVFKGEYFKNCAGGIIMLIFSAVQIVCMTLYCIRGNSLIRKHTFSLFASFKNNSSVYTKNSANPPKKNNSKSKSKNNKTEIDKKDKKLLKSMNNNKSEKKNKKKNKPSNSSKKVTLDIKDMNENTQNKINKITEDKLVKLEFANSIIANERIENEEMYNQILQDLINPEFDENDFDDVINKDRRTFLQFFAEKSFKNQIFIKTFCIKHIFKPFTLKMMLLVLIIEIYFMITALFYTESYLSDRFYSNEKESFLSFIPKRIYEIIITLIICGIIQYFCSYFFDNDDYLRRIFMNKIKIELDLALVEFIKNIKRKFYILIAISLIITIFSFLYIACFNVVYPYIKSEWVKCSVFILIVMQIINTISTLLGTCCRYLSIKWNNLKLFRLSLNLE